MRRVGGFRRKTRSLFKKNFRDKGKISIRRFFQKLVVGDKVHIVSGPAYQQGMYDPKFYGRVGVISGMQGKCYLVDIKEGSKAKTLIVHPIHLKKKI